MFESFKHFFYYFNNNKLLVPIELFLISHPENDTRSCLLESIFGTEWE